MPFVCEMCSQPFKAFSEFVFLFKLFCRGRGELLVKEKLGDGIFSTLCAALLKKTLSDQLASLHICTWAPTSEIMMYHLFDVHAIGFSVQRQEGLEYSVVTNQF